MNNITIVCDSSSDLSLEYMKNNDIKFLPLLVDINGTLYKDKLEITNEEFFKKIEDKDTVVKSSQVTPYVFENFFREEIEKGNEVICITISGKLSGTNSAANIAKESLGEDSDKVTVIDSLVASGGLGYLVSLAAKMKKEGQSSKEITHNIIDLVKRMKTLILMDTVEMLKRGGRISQGKALASTLMGIKPLITVKDGELEPIGKARGSKKAMRMMVEKLSEFKLDKNHSITIGHANCLDSAKELISCIEEKLGFTNFNINEIGSAVGVYSGPGALTLFCIEE